MILCSNFREFASGPAAKTPCSQGRGPGLIPGQGTSSYLLQLRVCMLGGWQGFPPAGMPGPRTAGRQEGNTGRFHALP